MVAQFQILLEPLPRGFHLITNQIMEQIQDCGIRQGIVHVFIQHTSASLSINENADPSVRVDMESYIDKLVPEKTPYFTHTYEGSDDMPAHIKCSLLGSSVSFPLNQGKALLGTWQGIYLCEHRDFGGRRKLLVTVYGE
jgi:secondary thiamine-phosphate synthase enzyme